ncbi:hypothetical protein GE09DRAFT_225400 [Coniochaeta sp. 2T2.1]|nr:hypothetical protein GE09DRAFT_225400 [Coniochaeta sp. 2T2.1]
MEQTYLQPRNHPKQSYDDRLPQHYHSARHSHHGQPLSFEEAEKRDSRCDRHWNAERHEPKSRTRRSAAPGARQHGDAIAPKPTSHGHSTESSGLSHNDSRSCGRGMASRRVPNTHRRSRSEDPMARNRKEHAFEKAIGAGSAAAFHVRNSSGSWVGAKGLKVVGAASAAALIDYTLDRNPKDHKIWHTGVSLVQARVIEAILQSGQAQ